MTRLLIPLLLGLAAVVGASLLVSSDATNGIAAWPPVIRAALVGVCVAIGLALLGRAVTMLADREAGTASAQDIRPMIRAVRLAFLAVAAFAASGAFLVGHPLLLVVALIIAGVDVLETSFLLLVARTRDGDDRPRS
jgi:hypothetical protein